MLKIKDNITKEDIEKYAELLYHTCFTDDKLNTYRYRFINGDEIEITDKKIHYENDEECKWLLQIYNFINDLVEKVEE